LKTDTCKFESSLEEVSRAQSADYSKASSKTGAFNCRQNIVGLVA